MRVGGLAGQQAVRDGLTDAEGEGIHRLLLAAANTHAEEKGKTALRSSEETKPDEAAGCWERKRRRR